MSFFALQRSRVRALCTLRPALVGLRRSFARWLILLALLSDRLNSLVESDAMPLFEAVDAPFDELSAATSAAIAGVEERAIMAQTRHRSVAVARRYIRDGSLFRGNAAAAVGL
jgi:hypothetical protein